MPLGLQKVKEEKKTSQDTKKLIKNGNNTTTSRVTGPENP